MMTLIVLRKIVSRDMYDFRFLPPKQKYGSPEQMQDCSKMTG